MRIGVIGTGMVGRALAGKLMAGAEVVMGTRDPSRAGDNEQLTGWHGEHPGVTLATFADAAAHAELAINATAGSVSLDALALAGGENLAGKILMDISNPLDFSAGMPPSLFVSNTDSLGEQIQRAYPDVRVVKTLNTLNASVMVDPVPWPTASTTPSSAATMPAQSRRSPGCFWSVSVGATSLTSATSPPRGAPRCSCRCGCASWAPWARPDSIGTSRAEGPVDARASPQA
jgi:8-hydroxy-5-deazaflavin:NADPH oxidoreductase